MTAARPKYLQWYDAMILISTFYQKNVVLLGSVEAAYMLLVSD